MRWLVLVLATGCIGPSAGSAADPCAASADDAMALDPFWRADFESVSQAAGQAFGVRVEPHPDGSLVDADRFDMRWTEHGILYLAGDAGHVRGFRFDGSHPPWNASAIHSALGSLGLAMDVHASDGGAVAVQTFAGRPILTGAGGPGTAVHATWHVTGTPIDDVAALAMARYYASCSGWDVLEEDVLPGWGVDSARLVVKVMLRVDHEQDCPLYQVVHVEAFSGLARGSNTLSGCM